MGSGNCKFYEDCNYNRLISLARFLQTFRSLWWYFMLSYTYFDRRRLQCFISCEAFDPAFSAAHDGETINRMFKKTGSGNATNLLYNNEWRVNGGALLGLRAPPAVLKCLVFVFCLFPAVCSHFDYTVVEFSVFRPAGLTYIASMGLKLGWNSRLMVYYSTPNFTIFGARVGV